MHLQIAPQNTSLSPLCSPLHTSHPSQCLKGTFPLIPCQYWDLILSNLYSFARWKTPHLSHVIFMIIFSRDLGSACLMGEPILNFGFCGFYPLLLTSFWNLHFLILEFAFSNWTCHQDNHKIEYWNMRIFWY